MKKVLLLLALVSLTVGAWAEGENSSGSPIGVDLAVGLWYDALPGTGNASVDTLLALFNLRVGGVIDLKFKPSQAIGIGVEGGVQFWSFAISGITASYFDIPVNAKVEFSLGDIAKLDLLAGPMFSVVTITGSGLSGAGSAMRINLGGRIILGGFFIDGAYALSTTSGLVSFPRFGIGYNLSLIK